MPYLIHCGTNGCVDSNIIVGVATDKKGIYELLSNLYTVKKNTFLNWTLEEDTDDICIFPISENEYNFFHNYYKKICSKIDNNRKQYIQTINFNYECEIEECCTYFWHLFVEIDGVKNKLFNKEFLEKYYNIIENQKEYFS
jgi:hypothetical protein